MECEIVDFSMRKSDNKCTIFIEGFIYYMSKKKGLLIGFISVVLFAVAGVAIYLFLTVREKENELKNIKICDGMEEIQTITYSRDSRLGKLIKKDGLWYWDDESGLLAGNDRIEEQILRLSQLNVIEIIDESSELDSYGLKTPKYSMVLTDTNGKIETIYIGDETSDKNYYVKIEGHEKIYIMEKDIQEIIVYLDSQKRLYERLDTYTSPTR